MVMFLDWRKGHDGEDDDEDDADHDDEDDDDDEQAVLSSLAPLLSNWQKETSDPWLCSPHAGPLRHHRHHHHHHHHHHH